MDKVEEKLERTRADRYARLREWLDAKGGPPSRPFLDLEGSIRVGPGSVSEDIRKAREMSDRF